MSVAFDFAGFDLEVFLQITSLTSTFIAQVWSGNITVNSHYSGHPRDCDLVSVIVRVRNSGVWENFNFKPMVWKWTYIWPPSVNNYYLQKGVICMFIFINSSTFFRPVVASKERQNFNSYKESRRLLQNIVHLCLILKTFLWVNENQPLLREIYKDPPLLSYRKGRSLENVLVRAKLWRSKLSYLDQ